MISQHTSFLAQRLYQGIVKLQHSNGRPLCVIYNDNHGCSPYNDPKTQGATVAFNVVNQNGNYIGHSTVESLANEKQIYLRSGGLCNPGGIAGYLRVEPWQFKRAWSSGYRCGHSGDLEVIQGKPMGVVRSSLGAMTTNADIDIFLAFLVETFFRPESVLVNQGIPLINEGLNNNKSQRANMYLPKHSQTVVTPSTLNMTSEELYPSNSSETLILAQCFPENSAPVVKPKTKKGKEDLSPPVFNKHVRPRSLRMKMKLLPWRSFTYLRS